MNQMNKTAVIGASKRISSYIHVTPILESEWLNDWLGVTVFFKCENFQKSGSFKMRGALNAIMNLSEEQKKNGVVTHSSGNFAQALSKAAQSIGVNAYIVMPENAPSVKVEAVKQYHGDIYFCEATNEARQSKADAIQQETGATFIHPSNDPAVIIGQGTAALELISQVPNLNGMIVPVGGGGLLAGTILAADGQLDVYAGEPDQADDAFRSVKVGQILQNETTLTVADGLRTHLGNYNFPIIQAGVKEIICVSEDEILLAMQHIWERMKIVVEPSSAVALAAVKKRQDLFKDQRIGILLSGGNVDVNVLFQQWKIKM